MSLNKLHKLKAEFGGHTRVPVTSHTSVWIYTSVRGGWTNLRN